MQNIFSKHISVYAYAVIFWVVLFIISALFIDPATGDPRINMYLFHGIMFVISLAILYPLFSYFRKRSWNHVSSYVTFVIVNVILDLAILVPLVGVPFFEWCVLILPAYIVGAWVTYVLTK